MNVLGELQCQLYKGQITGKKYYTEYYRYRNIEERKWYSRLSVKQRKRLHGLLLLINKIKNRLGGFSYEIINNRSYMKAGRPVIYAITHVGKFDIEVISDAIRNHYYLLTGDFERMQGTIYVTFLGINGVIYFNEKVKKDRIAATGRMIKVLRQGANLMYFPEGTWNLSPNLPVLPCYWGIVDVAKKGNAAIIPVAACQYEKHFKINIGRNIDVTKINDSYEEKTAAINQIRDELAALSWEIYETGGIHRRKTIDAAEWEKYRAKRFSEWTYFHMDYVEELVYKPKGITPPQAVRNSMSRIQPDKANCFLFDKRNSGNMITAK